MELSEALFIQEKPLQKVTTTPLKFKRQQRYDKTIDLMLHTDKSITTIAQEVGISRKTLYVYWNEWKQTEEAAEIDRRWHRVGSKLDDADDLPSEFQGLTRVKVRMTTERTEVKAELSENKTVTYNLNYSEEDKNAILSARRAILAKRKLQSESISIH